MRGGVPKLLLVLLFTGAATLGWAQARFITATTIVPGDNDSVITVEFGCNVEYIAHAPSGVSDRLRIRVDTSTLCYGVVPTAATSREMYRPPDADTVGLREIFYNGKNSSRQVVELAFVEAARFEVLQPASPNSLKIRVMREAGEPARRTEAKREGGVRVNRESTPAMKFAINLSSSQRPHTAAEIPAEDEYPDLALFETKVMLAGQTWHRLRLGFFDNVREAEQLLPGLQARFPHAWIDAMEPGREEQAAELSVRADAGVPALPSSVLAGIGLDTIDELMAEGLAALKAGEYRSAVQFYTKVLRVPDHDRHADAQEMLAVAREKNGQVAHAKAEYQRYLDLYPDDGGAARVRQRLAALIAANTPEPADTRVARKTRQRGDWRVHTFLSQYYRRGGNQFNDDEEVLSQSALFSDINIDVRRRGERYDFSGRLTAGYRSDLEEISTTSNNQFRYSYAYVDLTDAKTGLRGRAGRQTRHNGGVLGRFDGLNLGYQVTEKLLLQAVSGRPVYSVSNDVEDESVFYGLSANYGPVLGALELGTFVVMQETEGLSDRRAVGGEFRYLGETKSIWGLVDYDTEYGKIGSGFLQGSWRVTPKTSLYASWDRRHSPYLSLSSALVGQPVESFADLQILLTEEEIRQLSIDRSALTSSVTGGLSQTLSPRLQINLDMSRTEIDATPASGGVAETPANIYRYVSANLVGSSILKEGDVMMAGLRFSDSEMVRVSTLALEVRFPMWRTWRVNARLRVDRRATVMDGGEEWSYLPGIRIQYRRSQKFRVELDAGKQYSQRETELLDTDRESYFVNIGYQWFF